MPQAPPRPDDHSASGVEGEVELQHVHPLARPARPGSRPLRCALDEPAHHVGHGQAAAVRDPGHLDAAYSGRMCGSRPLARRRDGVGGTSAGSTPSSSATAARRSSMVASRSGLSGPRLDPAEASVSYPSPAADGRGWNHSGAVEALADQRGARRPRRRASTSEPLAWSGNTTCPTAVTPAGRPGPSTRVKTSRTRRPASCWRSTCRRCTEFTPIRASVETTRSMSLMPMNGDDHPAEAVDQQVAPQQRRRRRLAGTGRRAAPAGSARR